MGGPGQSDPIRELIVHEDDDLLVVNKPPRMLTSSGPRDERPTLWRMIQARAAAQGWRKPMGIIHRLDRDASGLLVFSKCDAAYQSLKKQFFHHTVERIYMAIVSGAPRPAAGRIDNYLDEWKDGTVHQTRRRGRGERAISHYQTYSVTKNTALVSVKLETGRKHQIRVHLAGIGHPIVGDVLYHPHTKKGALLMLIAKRLCFDHPRSGKRMEFELPLPEHMRKCLRDLGIGDPDAVRIAVSAKASKAASAATDPKGAPGTTARQGRITR